MLLVLFFCVVNLYFWIGKMIFYELVSCYFWLRNIEIMLLGSVIYVVNLLCVVGKDVFLVNEGI